MKTAVPLGRGAWLSQLAPLPRVSLLRAPASTGKRTVAEYAATRAGVEPVDRRFWPAPHWLDEYGRPIDGGNERAIPTTRVEPELTIGMVREVVEWARTAPLASRAKVAVIRLSHVAEDGSSWRASEHLAATLLKTLEEPPRTARFILLATDPVPVMIRSRAQVSLEAGLLPVDVLTEVLVRVSDLTPFEAGEVAKFGGGRVTVALAQRTRAESSVRQVVDALTYLVARDRIALAEKARAWTEADTEMLILWCHERLHGEWVAFSGSGAPDLSRLAAERVLSAVSRVRGARPRLVLGAVAALAEK